MNTDDKRERTCVLNEKRKDYQERGRIIIKKKEGKERKRKRRKEREKKRKRKKREETKK